MEVHDDIIRHRLILHFKQRPVEFSDIKNNIRQLQDGVERTPHIIIVDGFPFEKADIEELKQWKALAEEKKAGIWFSATLHRDKLDFDKDGIPAPVNKFSDIFKVIIMLKPMQDYIEFELLKSHSQSGENRLCLKLDPRTMLISNHRV